MKLDNKEFKRFKELCAKEKAHTLTSAESAELDSLKAKKNERGSNALEWWKNYPALLTDAVNFPFNWIPGTRVDITGPGNTTDTLRLGVIAVARLRSAIGLSTSDADAFNAQIRQLWLDLHRKYRGIGTYEKSDLGITILAIDAAFEVLAKFERIYGVINSYKVGNRVVPAGLKEVLGIGIDLETNLADFRYQLNFYIEKMKQLCLPKGLGVLEADLVSQANIYKDSENERAFLFLFDNDCFGYYDPTSVTTGGAIMYKKYSTSMSGLTHGGRPAFTLADVTSILDNVVGRLLNDDDIARICSDLLAAYGPENVMQLINLPEDYKVEPVHDYERSLQFHNLTVVGSVASIYEDSVIDATTANAMMGSGIPICIYQNNNTVMCRLGRTDEGANTYNLSGALNYPTFNVNNVEPDAKEGEVIFDTWVDKPGELEIMCGTRYTSLCSTPQLVSTNVYRQAIVAFGTKVVTQVRVYRSISSGTYTDAGLNSNVVGNGVISSDAIFAIVQMDWHPIFYVTGANPGDVEIFGDIDNFTKITVDNLRRLHEVALLSGYKFAVVSA